MSIDWIQYSFNWVNKMGEKLCVVCCNGISDVEHCETCCLDVCDHCFIDFDCKAEEEDLVDIDGDYLMMIAV